MLDDHIAIHNRYKAQNPEKVWATTSPWSLGGFRIFDFCLATIGWHGWMKAAGYYAFAIKRAFRFAAIERVPCEKLSPAIEPRKLPGRPFQIQA
jgi:hypothetical protein